MMNELKCLMLVIVMTLLMQGCSPDWKPVESDLTEEEMLEVINDAPNPPPGIVGREVNASDIGSVPDREEGSTLGQLVRDSCVPDPWSNIYCNIMDPDKYYILMVCWSEEITWDATDITKTTIERTELGSKERFDINYALTFPGDDKITEQSWITYKQWADVPNETHSTQNCMAFEKSLGKIQVVQ